MRSKLGLQTSGQFPEVSRKVSGNLESFHSKVSGKFSEKFGNSQREKLERNKDIYICLLLISAMFASKLSKLTSKLGNISNIFSSKLSMQLIESFQVGTELLEILTNIIVSRAIVAK